MVLGGMETMEVYNTGWTGLLDWLSPWEFAIEAIGGGRARVVCALAWDVGRGTLKLGIVHKLVLDVPGFPTLSQLPLGRL